MRLLAKGEQEREKKQLHLICLDKYGLLQSILTTSHTLIHNTQCFLGFFHPQVSDSCFEIMETLSITHPSAASIAS